MIHLFFCSGPKRGEKAGAQEEQETASAGPGRRLEGEEPAGVDRRVGEDRRHGVQPARAAASQRKSKTFVFKSVCQVMSSSITGQENLEFYL